MNKKGVSVTINCKHYAEEHYSVDHYSILNWAIHRYSVEHNSVGHYSVEHDLGDTIIARSRIHESIRYYTGMRMCIT